MHSRAFTMVELLVVITIIAILMTLTLTVVGGLVSNARDAATRTTLSKIQGLLNARSQAFQRLTMRNKYVDNSVEFRLVQQWNATLPLANQIPASTQKILAMKLLQRRYFPQSILEVNPQYMINVGVATQANLLTNPQQLNSGNVAAASSSAILYDFLTQEFLIGDSPVGADAFSAAEVKTNTVTGLPEFVDAWGNPLRFYRWPTRIFRSGGQTGAATVALISTPSGPNPTQANSDGSYDVANAQLLFSTLPIFTGNLQNDLNRDPDDPLQECLSTFGTATKFSFEAVTGQQLKSGNGAFAAGAAQGPAFHTPATFHVFLVVSAGPDGALGMYEPDDIRPSANPPVYGNLGQIIPGAEDALSDNIVSLSIKAGGNR